MPAFLFGALVLASLVGVAVNDKPADARLRLSEAMFLPDGPVAPLAVWDQLDHVAGASAVSLPHDWQDQAPQARQGWYFLNIESGPIAGQLASLWVPRVAMNAEVFLNGTPLARRGQMAAPVSRNWNRPWLIYVPASLLEPGANLLALRVVAERGGRGMLRELYFGAETDLRGPHEQARFFSRTLLLVIVMFMMLTSVFMGLLWWWGRRDPMYGSYGAMLMVWAVHDLYLLVTTGVVPTLLLDWFWHASLVWFIYTVCIFVFRYLHRDEQRLEGRLRIGAIAATTLLGLLALFLPGLFYSWGVSISDTASLLVAVYPLICVLTTTLRRFSGDVAMLVLAGAFALALGAHDWSISMGFVDRTNNYLMPFGALGIMFVIGFQLVRRFGAALDGLEALNQGLERRVKNREQEIERAHERLLKLETERVIVRERERLVRDMHDGLGGTLISALAMVKSGAASQGSVEEALQAAIEDMRLMIDSMDPVDGDLVTVLASLRSRLAPRLEAAGLKVKWQVTDLPAIGWLGPQGVLGVMRILQEGINNVLKHARASTIEVGCGLEEQTGQVWIRLADNGVGMQGGPCASNAEAVAAISGGRGLGNMRQRALELGGVIEFVSEPGGGTQILLRLPLLRVPVSAPG